jgi:thiopurine S-methyltransferase
MDPSFWIERWDKRQIGFHQPHINPYLQAHWAQLGTTPSSTVLVPLCGKSRDMQWLQAQGHAVMGIEVSRQAVSEFFSEQQLQPRVTESARFEVWESPGYRLLCGDFFALEADDLKAVSAVFDRAALIALPVNLRQRYVAKLQAVLPAPARMLLVAMTYPQAQMGGPPFSVDEAEVRRLYAASQVEQLQDEDVLSQQDNARFKERGLKYLSEQVYRISQINSR